MEKIWSTSKRRDRQLREERWGSSSSLSSSAGDSGQWPKEERRLHRRGARMDRGERSRAKEGYGGLDRQERVNWEYEK